LSGPTFGEQVTSGFLGGKMGSGMEILEKRLKGQERGPEYLILDFMI